MTLPAITLADIDDLAAIAPDLSFVDAERRAVLLEAATCDVNAAPGSGKTTILAAKLLLLARKWPYQRRGICVLSHTNVARNEIQSRLSASAEGSHLLTYPHFIGTIHAFVNQFLAMPALRSKGLEVDVIDDDTFAKRATGVARTKGPLRYWMDSDQGVAPMVAGLVYRGSDLALSSESGNLPKVTAKTYPILAGIKAELTNKGIFRFADMFAFAEQLLVKCPTVRERLSRRFPLVFIDEMQDTSWSQEELLQALFDEAVIVQRLGDINQRVLVSDNDVGKLTFPMAHALPISTSKRFGPAIARVVAGVQLNGRPVVGERQDVHSPLLLSYSTGSVEDVIRTFGHRVLDRFDDQAIRGKHQVAALCARKQGTANEAPGRSLADYWPAYAQEVLSPGARSEKFWALLECRTIGVQQGPNLVTRAGEIQRAVLLVLRTAGSSYVTSVREGPQLFRRLQDAGVDVSALRRLCRDLALSNHLSGSENGRKLIPELMYDPLQPLLPAGTSLEKFLRLAVFAEPELPKVDVASSRACVVDRDGRQVTVQIGTVASMKGETHLATLVLESHGGHSRRFDLQEAIPILGGLSRLPAKMSPLRAGQFRNLYVAMSRPTSFLCLAANADRVTADSIKALLDLGWVVEKLD
jgi:DNA helicase-2/ATP-dependent DNA helicase PcrA